MNKVEAEENATGGKELRKQDSNPREPEVEPEKHLEEFQKFMIKHMKEREKANKRAEELNTLRNTLKTTLEVKTSLKTTKIRKVRKDEKSMAYLTQEPPPTSEK